MGISIWLEIAAVCIIGAMSPGPSLVVVLRNTVEGGRSQGIMCALGHGLAFFLYAGLAITGISILILNLPELLVILQFTGALFLLYLSVKMLQGSKVVGSIENIKLPNNRKGFTEGFAIAFLNPKIQVFLLAVFSQFVTPDISLFEQFGMAGLAGVIDGGWYLIVATTLAGTPLLQKMQQQRHVIDKWFGIILLIISMYLIAHSLVSYT